MPHSRRTFLASVAAGATAVTTQDAILDVDLKRTAIVVRDLERSLPFYRDVLGMSVDTEIRGDTAAVADSFPFGLTEGRFHLVILRSSPPATGRIALLTFSEPSLPPRERRELGVGDAIFVIETADARGVYARMQDASVEIYRPLYESVRTMSDGARYRVLNMTCYDPDGIFIEISQRERLGD